MSETDATRDTTAPSPAAAGGEKTSLAGDGDAHQATEDVDPPLAGSKDTNRAGGLYVRRFTSVWQDWSDLTLFSRLLVLSIPVMVGFVLYSTFCKTYHWVFSAQVKAGVLEVVTPADRETRWRINGAILCTRATLPFGDSNGALEPATSNSCGKRQQAYRAATDQDLVLVLRGRLNALFEIQDDSAVHLYVRSSAPRSADVNSSSNPAQTTREAPQELRSGARLSFTNGAGDIDLGNDRLRVNIIVPASYERSGIAHYGRLFPFSGDVTVGRDVNWAGNSLLESGAIRVYTADESPDKRRLVDETSLLLGDQLRLDPVARGKQTLYPKGFARLTPGQRQLDVIAFGAADRIRIERFGDNGYSFRPSTLSLLVHDPLFLWITGSYAGIIASLTGIAGVCKRKNACA